MAAALLRDFAYSGEHGVRIRDLFPEAGGEIMKAIISVVCLLALLLGAANLARLFR